MAQFGININFNLNIIKQLREQESKSKNLDERLYWKAKLLTQYLSIVLGTEVPSLVEHIWASIEPLIYQEIIEIYMMTKDKEFIEYLMKLIELYKKSAFTLYKKAEEFGVKRLGMLGDILEAART